MPSLSLLFLMRIHMLFCSLLRIYPLVIALVRRSYVYLAFPRWLAQNSAWVIIMLHHNSFLPCSCRLYFPERSNRHQIELCNIWFLLELCIVPPITFLVVKQRPKWLVLRMFLLLFLLLVLLLRLLLQPCAPSALSLSFLWPWGITPPVLLGPRNLTGVTQTSCLQRVYSQSPLCISSTGLHV